MNWKFGVYGGYIYLAYKGKYKWIIFQNSPYKFCPKALLSRERIRILRVL